MLLWLRLMGKVVVEHKITVQCRVILQCFQVNREASTSRKFITAAHSTRRHLQAINTISLRCTALKFIFMLTSQGMSSFASCLCPSKPHTKVFSATDFKSFNNKHKIVDCNIYVRTRRVEVVLGIL